ncbi:MAG: hypothetical protein IPL32_14125 [Chloracidobacterium sp.]|nr:hypothetical protein [Chloracidobacterium sp.]
MKQAFFLFVIFIAVSLSSGCSGNSEVGGQTNTQNATSSSIAAPAVGQSNTITSPAPGAGRPVLKFVPSPEDSQIAQATQNGKLYEVRIWKKHPKLLKVESTTIDEKNRSLSIVLRSAQVVNITTDRIPNVKLATADQFLKLVPATGTTETNTDPKKAE